MPSSKEFLEPPNKTKKRKKLEKELIFKKECLPRYCSIKHGAGPQKLPGRWFTPASLLIGLVRLSSACGVVYMV